MSAYRLSGLLSFRRTGAAFLIPCFAPDQSNEAFAQEVDEQGRIGRFLPIDVDRYASDPTVLPPLHREPGDDGVFAVRLSDGQVLIGGFDEVRRRLSGVDLEQMGSPFFNVDALAFIGDLPARDAAVEKASHQFRSARIAREWRRLESRGRIAGLARITSPSAEPDPKLTDLEWLDRYGASEDWPKRWLQAWSNPEARGELKRLAERELDLQNSPGDLGPVLQALVTDDLFNAHFLRRMVQWLGLHRYGRSWFATWTFARRRLNMIGDDDDRTGMIRMALDALARSRNAPVGLPPADWARLWTYVFRIPRIDRRQLVSLGLAMDKRYFRDQFFQQKVLATIAKRRRDRVEEVLVPWLLQAPVHNGWIAVYVNLDPARLPMELKHLAVEFLAYGNVRYRGWRTLWTSMRNDPGLNAPFDEFARRWLHLASPTLKAWPEVLAQMLQLYPQDRDIRELAYKWARDRPPGDHIRLLLGVFDTQHRAPA